MEQKTTKEKKTEDRDERLRGLNQSTYIQQIEVPERENGKIKDNYKNSFQN